MYENELDENLNSAQELFNFFSSDYLKIKQQIPQNPLLIYKKLSFFPFEEVNGGNILHFAVFFGDFEYVKYLISLAKINDENYSSGLISETENLYMCKSEYLEQITNSNFTPLCLAVIRRQYEITKFLLLEGANIEARLYGKQTPLHHATLQNNIPIMKLLLEKGADIDAELKHIGTALQIASISDSLEAVKLLVFMGANIEPNNEIPSPLLLACIHNHLLIVKYLIKMGANINICLDTNKQTPLYVACEKGHFSIVEFLVRNNCEINCVTKDLKTPLHIAILKNHVEIVKFLINNGADILMPATRNHYTCLELAVIENHYELTKLFVSLGLNVNHITYSDAYPSACNSAITPLFLAAFKNNTEIVKYLLSHGADPKLKNSNDYSSVLSIAVHNNNLEMSRCLLNYGVESNLSLTDSIYALSHAISNDNLALVKLLLNYIPTQKIYIYYKYHLLHKAVSHPDIFKYLILALNIDINQVSYHPSPFFLTVFNPDLMKYYIQQGLGNIDSEESELMAFYFVDNNDIDNLKYLLFHGVNINSRMFFNTSFLFHAYYFNNQKLIDLFHSLYANPYLMSDENLTLFDLIDSEESLSIYYDKL